MHSGVLGLVQVTVGRALLCRSWSAAPKRRRGGLAELVSVVAGEAAKMPRTLTESDTLDRCSLRRGEESGPGPGQRTIPEVADRWPPVGSNKRIAHPSLRQSHNEAHLRHRRDSPNRFGVLDASCCDMSILGTCPISDGVVIRYGHRDLRRRDSTFDPRRFGEWIRAIVQTNPCHPRATRPYPDLYAPVSGLAIPPTS